LIWIKALLFSRHNQNKSRQRMNESGAVVGPSVDVDAEVLRLQHCLHCRGRSAGLCADLPSAQLAVVEAQSRRLALEAGSVLFSQGDATQAVFTVTDGTLRLSSDLADGRRQVLGFPRRGDFFGFTALPHYDYSARALTRVELCRIEQTHFRTLIDTLRDLDHAYQARSEQQLYAARCRALVLGRRTALERVAGFILEVMPRSEGSAPVEVELPMTRGDIADYLGLTLETVSRCFSQLKQRGLIALAPRHRLRLLRPQAMAVAAGVEPVSRR